MNNVFANVSLPNHEIPDELEDARLGTVIADAINGRYEGADEIMKDVKATASKIGIKIVGDDEINIDDKWDDVFEVRGQRLCFRKHDGACTGSYNVCMLELTNREAKISGSTVFSSRYTKPQVSTTDV